MDEFEEIKKFIELVKKEKDSFDIAWSNIELFLDECEKRLNELEVKLYLSKGKKTTNEPEGEL